MFVFVQYSPCPLVFQVRPVHQRLPGDPDKNNKEVVA